MGPLENMIWHCCVNLIISSTSAGARLPFLWIWSTPGNRKWIGGILSEKTWWKSGILSPNQRLPHFRGNAGLRQLASLANFSFDSAMLTRSASTMDFSAKRTHAKARIIKFKICGLHMFQQIGSLMVGWNHVGLQGNCLADTGTATGRALLEKKHPRRKIL